MKIGIILHSQSGTTAKVARVISSLLTDKGYDVDTHLLRTIGKVSPGSSSFELKNIPETDGYECLILAGPVWAFSASPVIMKYINQLGRLNDKKALCFVTKGLPFQWTGGTRALNTMESELALSGAEILPGAILYAFCIRKDSALRKAVEQIVELLP